MGLNGIWVRRGRFRDVAWCATVVNTWIADRLRLIASSAASSSSSLTVHAGIVSVIRFSSGG